MADDFAEQVAGVAALAEPVRRDLYRYVVAQPDAVSRDQASAGVGVPRHTAKFHLDRLVDEGLLDTEFRRLTGRQGPGAGRPTKLYRRSGREVSVTRPGTALRPGRPADGQRDRGVGARRRAGPAVAAPGGGGARRPARRRGADVGRSPPEPGHAWSRPPATVLARHGYEPRRDGRRVTLANCPFHALATEHTELVCEMNLALVSAVAEHAADQRLAARLDPADGRCCVVLDAG